jgi:hypothetical protein
MTDERGSPPTTRRPIEPPEEGGDPDLAEFYQVERILRAGYQQSTARENMLEHVFVAEVLQEAWFVREQTVEVLRAEVDAYGYDLVMQSNGVTRWVQLKSSDATGSRKRQTVSRRLMSLAGACVVYLYFQMDYPSKRLRLCYLVYGGNPGEPMPDPGGPPGRNPVTKRERPGTVVIKPRQFSLIETTAGLLDWLFGPREASDPPVPG